jgi:hypothetical protein
MTEGLPRRISMRHGQLFVRTASREMGDYAGRSPVIRSGQLTAGLDRSSAEAMGGSQMIANARATQFVKLEIRGTGR